MKKTFVYLLLVLGLCCFFIACSTDVAIQKILGSSSEGPVFTGYKATASGFEFEFSQPVKVLNIAFNPYKEVAGIEDGTLVKIEMQEGIEEGVKLIADILVADKHGNTLNVLIPVRTRNNRMPRIFINEVRTEYSNPKVEFIEFKTANPGNLGALRVFAAGISLDEPIYEFPPAEVKDGEYVVLHLRTLDPASLDETGNNLALSPGTEASPAARDFWVPGTSKLIRKTDAVFITDQDDQILDVLMMSETQDTQWSKENLSLAANMLGSSSAWVPGGSQGNSVPGPVHAVQSQYTTTTRTICRDETIPDSNTLSDWYIAATSNATPGAANSSKRYEP